MNEPLHATLNRTAKYFMDNGRVQSPEEAMNLLQAFGLSIIIGPEISSSRDAQVALLTLVNVARRTFLAGVEIIGLRESRVITPLARESNLVEAVTNLGGRVVAQARADWPSAVIGSAPTCPTNRPSWRLTWEGWRAGVVPVRENWNLRESPSVPLAPALAAAICAAEVFAFHAGDNVMAGKRMLGLSLWRPEGDWTAEDPTEPSLAFLPSRLWLVGLGNLGQAYAWLLASLPYGPAMADLFLQDFDRLTVSNDSTSILTKLDAVGRMKTRWVSKWLEVRGFKTFLEERRFGVSTRRAEDEPGAALFGVDNAIARATLEGAGFDLVVESGLGAGPQSFRNFSMHTFPGPRRAEQLWPTTVGNDAPDVSGMPAYTKLRKDGFEQCGLIQLASRTVGVPFVGLIAAAFVISELIRRLHGGPSYGVISGSTMCLDDLEVARCRAEPYVHGFVSVDG